MPVPVVHLKWQGGRHGVRRRVHASQAFESLKVQITRSQNITFLFPCLILCSATEKRSSTVADINLLSKIALCGCPALVKNLESCMVRVFSMCYSRQRMAPNTVTRLYGRCCAVADQQDHPFSSRSKTTRLSSSIGDALCQGVTMF